MAKCKNCGITLNDPEELEWGQCVQCENEPVNIEFTKGFIDYMNNQLIKAGLDPLNDPDEIYYYLELLVMQDLGNF